MANTMDKYNECKENIALERARMSAGEIDSDEYQKAVAAIYKDFLETSDLNPKNPLVKLLVDEIFE